MHFESIGGGITMSKGYDAWAKKYLVKKKSYIKAGKKKKK